MTVYGTRPEAIKLATLLSALDADEHFTSVPVVTGQHREMLDQVNSAFGIVPLHDLDLMRPDQQVNAIVSGTVAGLDALLVSERPDAVVVHGDTSTAMAAAIAAFNRQIPVVHLEAGLRTGDIGSPFPEEANRQIIGRIAHLHLAPTMRARANLLHEAVDPDSIVVTGNTVIDALQQASAWTTAPSDPRISHAISTGRPIILATAHRRENLGPSMDAIGRALAGLADLHRDHLIVLPVHRNPSVRSGMLPHLDGQDNIAVTEPMPYPEFTAVLAASRIVLTDSGGIQEEAPSLGKPVLVLRDNTERPEAVEAGTVRLVGTDVDRIVFEADRLLVDESAYEAMATAANPYGDGRATERAVGAIAAALGLGPRPDDFRPAPSPTPA